MTEESVIALLNKSPMFNFEKMDNKFSRYDAFDTESGIMLEIKCRKRHFDDTLLEKMKYDWNKEFAKENDFGFYYCVTMPHPKGTAVYLFDPLALEDEDEYDFKWHTKKLPAKTEFGRSNWIDKEVGYLHIDDALLTLIEHKRH